MLWLNQLASCIYIATKTELNVFHEIFHLCGVWKSSDEMDINKNENKGWVDYIK